jgi:hypothetical protein
MTIITGFDVGLAILAAMATCGRSTDEPRLATTSKDNSVVAQPTAAGPAGPKWQKTSCSIISAKDVASVVGKPVTPKNSDEVTTCEYLTGDADGFRVDYWNYKSEFEIMKGQIANRHKKSTPVSGLGEEAMYGGYGIDAGLAVRLADGRAFMVVGRDREKELAIAKLIMAAVKGGQ